MNYVLDHSYFRRYSQSARIIPESNNRLRMNVQTMSKADNYNKYNYDQALGEKYTGQR